MLTPQSKQCCSSWLSADGCSSLEKALAGTYLQPTHSQVVLLAGIPSQAQHSERDGRRCQAGEGQFPFAGVGLFQQG